MIMTSAFLPILTLELQRIAIEMLLVEALPGNSHQGGLYEKNYALRSTLRVRDR
jgi:hypothetical protein